MLKKLLTSIVIISLVFSLSACGGGKTLSKEESLDIANEFSFEKVVSDISENKARAEEKYVDSMYLINGFVSKIDSDYCVIEPLHDRGLGKDLIMSVKVYLSNDDLKAINQAERITVVGRISKLGNNTMEVKSAYFVDNVYTSEVEVISVVHDYLDNIYYTVSIDGIMDNHPAPCANVYFSSQDVNLSEGDTITIISQMEQYDDSNRHEHYGRNIPLLLENAEIVEN